MNGRRAVGLGSKKKAIFSVDSGIWKEGCCDSREQEAGYRDTSFRRFVRNINYTRLKLTVLPIFCLRGGFSRSV